MTDVIQSVRPTGLKKRKSKGKNPEYGSYLLKLLKLKHPDTSIKNEAMWVVNGIVEDVQSRLLEKSMQMAKLSKMNTLNAQHAQAAVTQLFSGMLQEKAVADGTKAVQTYSDTLSALRDAKSKERGH